MGFGLTLQEVPKMNDNEKESVGRTAGLGIGLGAGARLGAKLIPVPVVGQFAGAVVGGVVGSEAGKRVGKAVINGAGAFVDTLRQPSGEYDPQVQDETSQGPIRTEARIVD